MPVHACFNTDFFVPHAAPGGGRRFMIEEVEDEEKKEEGVPMIHLACLYDTHSPWCGKFQSIQLLCILPLQITLVFGYGFRVGVRARGISPLKDLIWTPHILEIWIVQNPSSQTRGQCACACLIVQFFRGTLRGRLTVMLVGAANLR